MERESSKECSVSFLWTNESFSLWNCLWRNSTLFCARRIGALGLFWTNQGSEVSEDTWGTFCTLWSKKTTFLKRNFCIYKGFRDVYYILTSAWKKNYKMCIWKWFFLPCARPIYNFSYTNCFLGLTYGIVHSLFIHNISSKNDHETTDREIFRNIQTGPFLN